jgi:crotonobetainyl-CoA:carnitine CoA-transferase CaiB-like acyl-CoA transferase
MSSIRVRGQNIPFCNEVVSAWTIQHDGVDIERMLIEAEVPVSRVYTMPDIFEDPHFAAREMLPQIDHPTLGPLTHPGVVPKLSSTPGEILRSGPNFGEDTRDVLRQELNYSQAQLESLEAQKIIFSAPDQ